MPHGHDDHPHPTDPKSGPYAMILDLGEQLCAEVGHAHELRTVKLDMQATAAKLEEIAAVAGRLRDEAAKARNTIWRP